MPDAAGFRDRTADGDLNGSNGARVWLASAVGAAMSIAGVAAASRLVGFGRTVTFARTVGATCLGDTYVTSNTVPNIVFEVVAGGALASMVVPVLAGAAERGDRDAASRTASALVSWALLVAVPVTVAGLLLARPLVSLLVGAGSANCDRHAEIVVGTRMLFVFMPQVVLYALCVVLGGVLQAHKRFLGPALAPLLSSMVVIGAYLLFGALHQSTDLSTVSLRAQLVLSIGTTLGVVALALPLLWPVSRLRLRWRPTLRFPQQVGRRVAGLAVAGALTLAVQQLSVAVVLRLAHRGDGGTLVLYNLAWAVFLVPWSVVAVPVATSAFPRLSARADRGDDSGYALATAAGLRTLVLTTAAATAALVAVAAPVARVLALRVPGNADTVALAWTLVAFAPGLIGYALVAYLGRALYARSDWRLAAVAICAGWVVVIVADLALVPAFSQRWRVVALGLGNSVGMVLAGALLVVGVRRASGRPALTGVGRTTAASALGAVVGGGLGLALVAGVGQHSVLWSVLVALLVAAVAGVACLGVGLICESPVERNRLRAQVFGARLVNSPRPSDG
ncbi:MAG: murein biosynthesis integral membrane protein MurJ [Acidothermaceae bacterium]